MSSKHFLSSILLFFFITILLLLLRYDTIKYGYGNLFYFVSFPFFLISIVFIFSNTPIRRLFVRSVLPILVFYAIVTLFYFNNINNSLEGIKLAAKFFIFSAIVFYLALKHQVSNTRVLIFSFLLLSTFIIFIPHLLFAKSLSFGSFYNLEDKSLIVLTTVEAPLITSILFLFSLYDITLNKKRNFLNIFSLLFSVFILLLLSRRGFIFSSIIAVFIYHTYNRLRSKTVLYLSFLLLLIPIFWDLLSSYLVIIVESDFVRSFLARADKDELLSATGRAVAWNNIINLFFEFDIKLLFGYPNGLPAYYFVETFNDMEGRYAHAHNTLLQLFVESGYIALLLFFILFIRLYKQMHRNVTTNLFYKNKFFLMILFLFTLSSTESLMRGSNFSNFIFLLIVVLFSVFNNRVLSNE